MSVVSQQSTSRDAQTETTSSANSGSSLVECSSIDAADEWITLETKVLELWEPTSSSVAQVATEPSAVLVAVLAVVLVGAVAIVLRSSTAGGDEEPDVLSPEDPDPSVQEVGAAAGRAADRIDASGDVENAVYRAWREMTTHLGVERPQSSTPGEFARAATRAGMAHEDVTELTDLFRAVRYGDSAVTDDRETRAVAALRRIEREYADASETPP